MLRRLPLVLLFIHAGLAQKKCGRPDNFASLPLFAREELDAVWKNYVAGSPCQKELDQTEEVLSVLDEYGPELGAFESSSSSGGSGRTFFSQETTEKITPPPPRKEQSRPLRSLPANPPPLDNDYADYHDPPPTQGKVAKSLKKIGSPAFKDYGDVELLLEQKRQRDEDSTRGNFFGTTRSPHSHSFRHKSKSSSLGAYPEYDFPANNFADDFNMHFDTPNAPFLKDASPEVRREFANLWTNDDVPSENLRADKVHLLAVSLLTGKQLEAFNTWATNRKTVLKAREDEMRTLSPRARTALRRITRDDMGPVSPSIRTELANFAQRLDGRRLRRARARSV